MSQRALSRGLLATITVFGLLVGQGRGVSRAEAAAPPPVVLGEVVVAGGVSAPELLPALRAALTEELSQVAVLRSAINRPLVVSATLTGLTSEQRDQYASASATISLVLRRQDDQVLFAELRGRARAEEAADSVAAVRQAALRGAVRSAVARLPEAARRSR
jgi:hypothetical protein